MKIALLNHGCAKNLVDSELMLGLLAQKGHQVTLDEKEAEIAKVTDEREEFNRIAKEQRKIRDELNASLKGDEIIYIEVKSIYGELYWKIKKESSFIFDTRLNHDQNEDDFTEIVTKNGNTVFMHTDEHFDMIIYEKDENGYKSVTFEDFDGIYYEKGKNQC